MLSRARVRSPAIGFVAQATGLCGRAAPIDVRRLQLDRE
jgi:hypothetical protein